MENGRSSVARVSPRAVQSGISTRRERQTIAKGTLTVNGSLRRSICANALERMEVRVKDACNERATNREFIRKCGSASSDDNRSREASSHVG